MRLIWIPSIMAAMLWGTGARGDVPQGEAAPVRDAIVMGNNRFALDLYQRLQSKPGNLFFSPASLSTALAMTYSGARGETAAQMAKVLHFDEPGDRLNADFAKLLAQWNAGGADKGYQLDVANALWGQKGYPFVPSFTRAMQSSYGAALHPVDFMQPEAARQTINRWVSDKTQQKIQNLIPSGSVTPQSVLVLTNAVYFKATWDSTFNKSATQPAKFTMADGTEADVPMMQQSGHFGYLEGPGFSALAMSYAKRHFSMIAFLAAKPDGLAELEKSLTSDKLEGWLGRLGDGSSGAQVIVSFPKFQTTQELELGRILSAMGMPLAFSAKADFTGMGAGPEPLTLSEAFHKAYVDVDEQGTEAAAATGVTMRPTAVPAKMYTFNADHPLLFVIRDNQTGCILFMGRVQDPR